jgi:predicted DNA-binding transcriptional regulator YafY
MSKRIYVGRFNLIIKKLRKGEATFNEINDFLIRESELQDASYSISKRTFQRDLDEIRSLYNIDIQYDFSRRVYFFSEDENPDINNRMLEAFDLFSALNMSEHSSEYIYFEKRRAQGTGHFYGLLHAIKNRFSIEMRYQKFWDPLPSERKLNPLALKEFKGRWYLLARDENGTAIKTYGLDRISDFTISKRRYEKFDYKELHKAFENCFGIINPVELKPEKIVLSFTSEQGKYLKTQPLHESQTVLIDTEDEYRISVLLRVTHDLIMELLSHGENLKVISPAGLRKSLCNAYGDALKQYN